MAAPAFGELVQVRAEVVRVRGTARDDGVVGYSQTSNVRDRGRFVHHDELTKASAWPGSAIPLEWEESSSPRFDPSPELGPGDVLVRLRRLPFLLPEMGIIIGPQVRRSEGRILAGANDDAVLAGPGRDVNLVEVALAPHSGKGRLVLAHPRDIVPAATSLGRAS
jgi:hypothetical protein